MAKQKAIVLSVQSDVEDVKQGFAEVRNAIGDMLNKSGKGTQSFIVNAGRAAAGLGQAMDVIGGQLQTLVGFAKGIAEVAKTTIELVQFAGEQQRLTSIVDEQTLARLRFATQGMVKDTDLLRSSAKAMQGEFALTTDQLEIVGRAARTLHQRGLGPTRDIFEKITDEMRRGSIPTLQDYGLNLEGVNGIQNQFNSAIEQLSAIANEASSDIDNMADEMQQNLTALSTGWDTLKNAAGSALGGIIRDLKVQIGLTQLLANVQKAQDNAAKARLAFLEKHKKVELTLAESILPEQLAIMSSIEGKNKQQLKDMVDQGLLSKTNFEGLVRQMNDAARAESEADKARKARDSEQKAAAAERAQALREEIAIIKERNKEVETFGAILEAQERAIARRDAARIEGNQKVADALTRFNEENTRVSDAIESQITDFGRMINEAEDYKSVMQDMAVNTFQQFGSAVGEAFGLLITGQDGAGAALEAFAQKALVSLASQMQAEAIMALGIAVGSLFTNPAIAASKFKSFAILQAGALALGAGAAIAGGGGGGEGDSASSAPRPTSEGRDTIASGSSSGGGTTINNTNLGFGFVGDPGALQRFLNEGRRRQENGGGIQPTNRRSTRT